MTISGLPLEELGMPLRGLRRAAFNRLNERIYSGEYRLEHTHACFCGSNDLESLSKFDRFGLPFGTVICRSCGLITLDRHLAEADLPSFYDELYWPLITGSHAPLYETTQEDYRDFLAYVAPLAAKARVVMEIGCGSGHRLEQLRSALGRDGCRYIGCDYSAGALERAAERGIEVVQGGPAALASHSKADLLIMSHVFEHFVNLDRALREVAALIHDDSVVYIEVPGVIDLENKREYGYDYQDYCVLAHIHNFSLATLSAVVGRAGLRLIRGEEYVRAVFSMNAPERRPLEADAYRQILAALQRAKARAAAHRAAPLRRARAVLAAVRATL